MSRWTARRAAVAALLLIGALTGGALAAVTPLPAIGYLSNEPTPDSLPVLRAALRERAWVEGRSIELWPRYAQGKPELYATQAAAQAQSIEIVPFEVKGDSDVREVFVKIKEQRVQALVVLADALTLARREAIAKAASRNGLPSVFALRDFVDAGGLISYGATWTDVFRQAAGFVDQILRGARPADLPLARASRFELIVNLRTARSIPVSIPLPLLRRADRVIQ